MRAALNALALIKFADKAYESIPQEENKRFSEKKKKKICIGILSELRGDSHLSDFVRIFILNADRTKSDSVSR